MQSNFQVAAHDLKFLFGDLNFRIKLDYQHCKELIDMQDYHELMKFDELIQVGKKMSPVISNLDEGSITFNPTYKYKLQSQEYEEGKQRVPSWTDRILNEVNGEIGLIFYGRAEIEISDHRPIFGLFEVKVRKIN